MIFNALAAVESVTFGVEDFGIARLGELAAEINRRAEEIAAIVA
jgi:ATP-dependent protease HslVU (ClpYQ) ATPase subunit